MDWYVYILLCDQKIFYVGMTSNLDQRINQHRNHESLYTKKLSDIELKYYEKYQNKQDAEKREKQLKGWSIAKKKSLIEGDITKLQTLSRSI